MEIQHIPGSTFSLAGLNDLGSQLAIFMIMRHTGFFPADKNEQHLGLPQDPCLASVSKSHFTCWLTRAFGAKADRAEHD